MPGTLLLTPPQLGAQAMPPPLVYAPCIPFSACWLLHILPDLSPQPPPTWRPPRPPQHHMGHVEEQHLCSQVGRGWNVSSSTPASWASLRSDSAFLSLSLLTWALGMIGIYSDIAGVEFMGKPCRNWHPQAATVRRFPLPRRNPSCALPL